MRPLARVLKASVRSVSPVLILFRRNDIWLANDLSAMRQSAHGASTDGRPSQLTPRGVSEIEGFLRIL